MKSQCFQDFDAFKESVRGVDCSMMLQNPEQRIWSVSRADVAGIEVQVGRLGSGNIVQGRSSRDGYMIYLPLTAQCRYAANGTVLGRSAFMILEPGCGFCIRTEVSHDWCTILVPARGFSADRQRPPLSPAVDRTRCRVARTDRRTVKRFQRLVGETMNAAATCPQFEQSPAAIRVAAHLMNVAALILEQPPAHAFHEPGRPRVPREEIMRRCHALLQEHEAEPVHVKDLAAAGAVSERTVRRAFREYYGVGPVRYLQLRRLHQIHRALKAVDPEAGSVTDVLVRHGEWAFGRFARRYHDHFGELPSDSLRRNGR